jgi:hypothetical protein
MIEPVRPVIMIRIHNIALTAWAEGERLPNKNDIKFTQTELSGWRTINISYKTYVDLISHFEELDNQENDLPF